MCVSVPGGAPHGIDGQVGAGLQRVGQAHVSNLGSASRCQQHIGGLDVEVDDGVGVQVVQTLGHVQRDRLPPGSACTAARS